MKKQVLIGFISFAVLISCNLHAQPGWNWGNDVDMAKEKNALYTDNLKAGNYEEAKEPLEWLLENTPNLNVSLYQNGAKIYEGLAEATKDKAEKAKYQEKALLMYDKRIEHYGDEAKVLNRKGYRAYKFLKDKKEKYEELLKLYDKIFELNGPKVYANNLVAYMDVVRRYKLSGGNLSDKQVLEKYSIISDVIDTKLTKKPGDKTILKMAENVDKILLATLPNLSCDMVTGIFGPRLKEKKELNMAKKVFQLMLTGKCTDDPLAFEAARIIHSNQPNFGIAKFMAQRAAVEKKTDLAIKYYKEAQSLTDENTKKAEVSLSIAKMYIQKKQKPVARAEAKKALAYDPSFSDAYKLIGDLYMNSQDDCKKGISRVEDRAVFIAAYNMYKKAGATTGMIAAKAQFPSIDEIFNEGMEEGQIISTGCWVNESVKLERRPAN